MVQREFLNLKDAELTSYILAKLKSSGVFSITITDCNNEIRLHDFDTPENNIYKLNTLVNVITNLRDAYVFLQENRKKIEKKHKTKEEAEQMLNQFKEKQPLLFENAVIRVTKSKKESVFYIDF